MGIIKMLKKFIKGVFVFFTVFSLGNYYFLSPMIEKKIKKENPELMEKLHAIDTSSYQEIQRRYKEIYNE